MTDTKQVSPIDKEAFYRTYADLAKSLDVGGVSDLDSLRHFLNNLVADLNSRDIVDATALAFVAIEKLAFLPLMWRKTFSWRPGKDQVSSPRPEFVKLLLDAILASQNIEDKHRSLICGCLHYLLSDYSAADEKFKLFCAADNEQFIFKDGLGAYTFRNPFSLDFDDGLNVHEVRWARPFVDDGSHFVVLMSCNLAYAVEFIPRFIGSLEGEHAGFTLHIEIVLNKSQTIENIRDFVDNICGTSPVNIAVSFTQYVADNQIAYFANRRFMILGSIMSFYSRPVISIDADSAWWPGLSAELKAIMEVGTEFIGLAYYDKYGRLYPWRTISAAMVMVSGKIGVQFASLLSSCSSELFSLDSPQKWFVDQNALLSTEAFWRKHSRESRIVNIKYIQERFERLNTSETVQRKRELRTEG